MQNNNEQINENLNLVLGYIAIKDIEDVKEQVIILSRLDFKNSEIGKICNLKESSVRSIKSRRKNK